VKFGFFNKRRVGGTVTNTVIIEVPVPVEPDPNEPPAGIFGTAINGSADILVDTLITSDFDYENLTIKNGSTLTLGWNSLEGRPARIRVNNTLRFEQAGANISVNGANAGSPQVWSGSDAGAGGSDGADGAHTLSTEDGGASANVTFPSIGSRGADGGHPFGGPPGYGGVSGTINYQDIELPASIEWDICVHQLRGAWPQSYEVEYTLIETAVLGDLRLTREQLAQMIGKERVDRMESDMFETVDSSPEDYL